MSLSRKKRFAESNIERVLLPFAFSILLAESWYFYIPTYFIVSREDTLSRYFSLNAAKKLRQLRG